MMTKQDFIALADWIRSTNEFAGYNEFDADAFTPQQIDVLAYFCAQQNPRFNRQLWLDYVAGLCGPNRGKQEQ